MANQLQKKFLGNDQVDGDKIKLEQGQSIRAVDSSSNVVDLIKLGVSDEVLVNGDEVALKGNLDQEIIDRAAGDASTLSSAEAYTDQKIADLVDSAPALLDTLNELAAALGDDPNFVTTVTTLVSNVQSEIDATQSGAGLETSGAYVAPVVSNYLSAAVSLKDADSKLDTQIKTVADDLAQEIIDRAADVDAEQSRAEAAESAIADDVSHLVTLSGVAVDSDNLGSFSGTTIADNQTIKQALQDLESAVEAVSGGGSSTQIELDATQVGAGLETDGSYIAPVVSNYLSAATSLKSADSALDSAIKVVADDLAQEAIDRADADALKVDKAGDTMSGPLSIDEGGVTTSTLSSQSLIFSDAASQQVYQIVHGSGLEASFTDGTSITVSANYYEGALELNALSLDQSAADGSITVDALGGYQQTKTNYQDQTVGSVNLTSSGLILSHDDQNAGETFNATYGASTINLQADLAAGQSAFQVFPDQPVQNLASDGSAPAPTLDTHLTSKKYVDDSIAAISSGSIAALQSEVNDTQVGAGLETDGSYSAPVGSNYLGSAVSLKDADSKLDAQIKIVADDLAQEIIDRAADVDAEQSRAEAAEAALQSDINDVANDVSHLVTLSGVAVDSDNLGSFSGSTISDNQTIKAAIQDLETAHEAHINDASDAHDASAISLSPAINGQTDVQSALADHESRIDVLESVVWFKEKFPISNSQTFVTLAHTPEANSMSAWVDRLAIHEGAAEDYTISGTTMTFLNDLVAPGESEIGAGDTVYVKYQYKV